MVLWIKQKVQMKDTDKSVNKYKRAMLSCTCLAYAADLI